MQYLPKLQHVALRPPPSGFYFPSGSPLSSVLLDFQLWRDPHKVEFDVGDHDWLRVRIPYS